MQLIENELDTQLLIRHSRSIELTEAGKLLYRRALSILNQIEDTVTEVRDTGNGLRGTLKIGASRTCATKFLPEKINAFLEKYPQVNFQIIDGHPSQVVQYLDERFVEIAIVRFAEGTRINHFTKTLLVEPYALFVPKKWKMVYAENQRIVLEDLEEIPLIQMTGSDRYHAVFNECERRGIKINTVCECQDASILLSLVTAGIGAAVMPLSTLSSYSKEGINIVEIKDFTLKNESILIWSKDRPLSKIAQRFIDMLDD